MRKALPLVVAGAVAVALGLVGSAALASSFGTTPTEAAKQISQDGSQPFTDENGERKLPTFYGSR